MALAVPRIVFTIKNQSITWVQGKGLLGKSGEPTQAAGEIAKAHLRNFVVINLEEELAIDLDEDVEVTTESATRSLAEPRETDGGLGSSFDASGSSRATPVRPHSLVPRPEARHLPALPARKAVPGGVTVLPVDSPLSCISFVVGAPTRDFRLARWRRTLAIPGRGRPRARCRRAPHSRQTLSPCSVSWGNWPPHSGRTSASSAASEVDVVSESSASSDRSETRDCCRRVGRSR